MSDDKRERFLRVEAAVERAFERTVGRGHWMDWTASYGRTRTVVTLGRDEKGELAWRAADADELLAGLKPA